MDFPNNENSALDTLENELYNPKKKMNEASIHDIRDRHAANLPSSWGGGDVIIKKTEEEKGFSFGTKLLLVSSIVLLAALSFTAWRVLSSRNVVSSAKIEMETGSLTYVRGGESTLLSVTVQNRNLSPLLDTTVNIQYKKGSGAQDEQEKVYEKRNLGTLNPNELNRQEFQVTLYGSEAESRDITIKLEYKVAGSNAVFSKVITRSVVLQSPPISVLMEGPKTLSIGQLGDFVINIKNNTSSTSLESVLQLDFPDIFVIESSSPKIDAHNRTWVVPALNPGETYRVKLSAHMLSTKDNTVTVKASIGSQGDSPNSIGVVYSSQIFDFGVQTSPLVLGINLRTDIGGADVLRYGDRALLSISYLNSSDSPIHNIKLKVTIDGDAALLAQISPNNGGYYDSASRTITWDKISVDSFNVLSPKAAGEVSMSIPIVSKGISSPALKITVSGIGTSVQTDDMSSSASKSWVVQGSASLKASTFYKNSPFKNSGPIPPEPNRNTSYTAHLTVSTQNALTNAQVSFTLPNYVTWQGMTSDNANISYNTKTNTVTWKIDRVDAGKTVSADIGLSVRPSQSHVGQSPQITSGIVLDADEESSKAHIRTTISALTTYIYGESWGVDPSVVVGQ